MSNKLGRNPFEQSKSKSSSSKRATGDASTGSSRRNHAKAQADQEPRLFSACGLFKFTMGTFFNTLDYLIKAVKRV